MRSTTSGSNILDRGNQYNAEHRRSLGPGGDRSLRAAQRAAAAGASLRRCRRGAPVGAVAAAAPGGPQHLSVHARPALHPARSDGHRDLTDARLGLDRQWVRITEITENEDGTLLFVAEDYLAGTGSAAHLYLRHRRRLCRRLQRRSRRRAGADRVRAAGADRGERARDLAGAGGRAALGRRRCLCLERRRDLQARRAHQRSGADGRADRELRGRAAIRIRPIPSRSISRPRAARCSRARRATPISAIRFAMSRTRRAATSSSAMRAQALPAQSLRARHVSAARALRDG